jgi:hypothetical protein
MSESEILEAIEYMIDDDIDRSSIISDNEKLDNFIYIIFIIVLLIILCIVCSILFFNEFKISFHMIILIFINVLIFYHIQF